MFKLEGEIKFDNKFLKDLRLTHGWTLTQMSKELINYTKRKTPYTREMISQWERGLTIPSTRNIIAIAKLYGVKISALFIDSRYDPESVPDMIAIAQQQLRNAQIKLRKQHNGV